MSDNPNIGFGRCKASHEVLIKVPMSILMVGGGPALMSRLFEAVHASNRMADDDFVGINFPDFAPSEKGFNRFGRSVLLVGSENALGYVLKKPKIAQIVDEFGFDDIFPHDLVSGVGQAIFRDQSWERHTKGDLERRIRRAERLGKSTAGYEKGLSNLQEGKRAGPYKNGFSDLFVHLEKMKFSMRVAEVETTGVVEVTTYGVSTVKNPLVCRNNTLSSTAAD